MDYALRFADREQFVEIAESVGWSHTGGESITGHPCAVVCAGGTGVFDGLIGYHVNVRGELPAELDAFVVIPAEPRQVWA